MDMDISSAETSSLSDAPSQFGSPPPSFETQPDTQMDAEGATSRQETSVHPEQREVHDETPQFARDHSVTTATDTVNANDVDELAPSTPAAIQQESLPSRSTRRRVAPTRLEIEYDTPSRKSQKKTKAPQASTRRIFWTADHLLQNPKSKLTKVDLMALLCDDSAWTNLSNQQQIELLSAIPGAPTIEAQTAEPLPNIAKELLKSNIAFQADVRIFQEDLAGGRLDPEWLKEAQLAMEMRARGDFDNWKHQNLEEFWGQKQKLQNSVIAGESSKIKLEVLVRAGCFMVGDVWVYCHAFGKGKNATLVEKEAKITLIAPDGRLAFSFPPLQYKFSSPANGEDIQTGLLDTPQSLATAIVKEDGRLVSFRIPNAWKEFRCFRQNQDIGSPWEIRETYHHRQEIA